MTVKVIVFGATGNSGLTILERCVHEGFNVTAYVRTPSKIPEKLRKDVKTYKGNVLDKVQVADAIEGHNVVLSALGTGWGLGPTTLMSEGCRNIVAGMKKHGVKKLAVIGVESLLPGHWKPLVLKNLIEDHQRQVDILNEEKSSIDWVAIMPPSLWKSSHISPSYMVEKNDQTGRWYVTTGEVADFMMKYVKEESTCKEYRHVMVGISSGPAIISARGLVVLTLLAGTAFFLYYFRLANV